MLTNTSVCIPAYYTEKPTCINLNSQTPTLKQTHTLGIVYNYKT